MTTREKTDKLPPLEKIAMLTSEYDLLRSQIEHQINQEKSLDELVKPVSRNRKKTNAVTK